MTATLDRPSFLVPALGETIMINLGAWTYAWDHQLFGVPLQAMLLLTVLHTGIYLMLCADEIGIHRRAGG